MKVSLALNRELRPPDAGTPTLARPMLSADGPRVILGGQNAEKILAAPILPSRSTMFGPRGGMLAGADGPLVVCDTGHHRLMIWNRVPDRDNTPCDMIIGQPDPAHEGRNAKSEPNAATLNVPTGLASDGRVLVVADAWNHRVLIWNDMPTATNQPADVVLGQDDFTGALANRGGAAGSDTLNWCYGVALINGNLVVADTGNRRVLLWDGIPDQNRAPATMVLGQGDFHTHDENAGLDPGPLGMRWPHSITTVGDKLLVSDAGNNRIMIWETWPDKPGTSCDYVLGQKDANSLEHNRAAYLPEARALNMPYGMAVMREWLLVADTANSRLVGWRPEDLSADAPASGLAAQPDFTSKGDNRWKMPERDSLCWPYGLSTCRNTLVIADSGNNRVMLWDLEE